MNGAGEHAKLPKHSPFTLEMFHLGKTGTPEQQAELISELSNSLNNLRWGFKKRYAIDVMLENYETIV